MKLVKPASINNPVMSIAREHEIQKQAKELAVGLPIGEEAARAIVLQIGDNPLAVATFGGFIEALQEAIEDSIATLAFGSHSDTSSDAVRRILGERLGALSKQTQVLLAQLPTPPQGNNTRVGASSNHPAIHTQNLDVAVEND